MSTTLDPPCDPASPATPGTTQGPTSSNSARMTETFHELVSDVLACTTLESLACGKGLPPPPKTRTRRRAGVSRSPPLQTKVPFDLYERVSAVVKACRVERKRARAEETPIDVSDQALSKQTRFTDSVALANYAPFLHYLPRLVNIVRALLSISRLSISLANFPI